VGHNIKAKCMGKLRSSGGAIKSRCEPGTEFLGRKRRW